MHSNTESNDKTKVIKEVDMKLSRSSEFNERGFWKKIKKHALKAGREVIEKALTLYYVASDRDTPAWARAALYAALAYFVSPVDVIPDVLAGVGFTDDLSVMAAALAASVAFQKDEHVERARLQLSRWFA